MASVTQVELETEWLRLAPTWIREIRARRDANREGLLDEPMLALCGDVRGLRALDCGCGEGRFCRMLAARGAEYVLGLDLCEPMIDAARELQSGADDYRVANVEDLSFLEEDSFDLAVSYLNQCDLAGFEVNTREVFRVLRPGGRFVVANVHPMRTAIGGWLKDSAGTKLHCILDRYFDEGARNCRMMGADFTNFHRTLATYVSTFLRTGFVLEQLIEPTVTEENLSRYPDLDDERRVPNFILYALKKPAIPQTSVLSS